MGHHRRARHRRGPVLHRVRARRSPAHPQAGPSQQPATAAVTPAAAPLPSARPADQLDLLRREIDRLARSGGLSPKDAGDLRKKVQDVEKRLRKDGDDAAEKAEDLLDRLDDLRADGRLSAPAYQTLAPLATRLADTLT
ncbi:FIMAH domain-containing protein [Catellatospora bangladeshensis]|uniref:FIMAH domain-containing protein n=1 Tax=Catellatospora bangladeshensis TaxID=310355 RepID=UPI0036182220